MRWKTSGFQNQKKTFETMVTNGQLSHAYIFQGPDQIGKKMFAQDLFLLINGREFDQADPDVRVIAPDVEQEETKIYVEAIRDLKYFLALSPFYGPYQFVIIDDAHRLTTEASNAFLKLLEEPTGKVIVIMITSQPQELLPTISSRAQHISFLPHSESVVAAALGGTSLAKTDQAFIAEIARGRIGWAINMAQESKLKSIKQSVKDFAELLKSPLAERMLYAKTMFEKQPYHEQVEYWLSWAYAHRSELERPVEVLSQLLTLHQYIQQPQYNHRALLETALINL